MRVLVVDDRAEFLDVLSQWLCDVTGIEIVGRATDGEEAVREAVRIRPDLVVMDLFMPGMNGLEATVRIKQQPDPPQVVIASLYDGPQFRAAAEEAGADGFLSKGELADTLGPLLRTLFPDRNRP